ncbi:MAG TPA: RNA-directed DNA polymerase [Candidatus Acidoferrum sp.]|nr:RNA-directed DNA polymerase [Candidatus Acidoferrum sp.]
MYTNESCRESFAGQLGARAKLRWRDVYREAELYKAAVRIYTKPLFSWRKALFASTDKKDLYDFARSGLHNLADIHRALVRESFSFRPAAALHRNFRGKRRTLYIYPWEERLVDLLLYRLLSARLHSWFSQNCYAYRLRGFGLDRCQRRIARLLGETEAPLYAVKRDIANYFPSVNHGELLAQLAELIEPKDYLFRLLEERVRFPYEEKGRTVHAEQGIAFGTPVACFFANVYLTPLDRRLDALRGLRYFRYADDVLLLASSRETIETAIAHFNEELRERKLQSKESHETNLLLSCDGARAADFTAASRIRHLGLEFCADGAVRLSRDKCRKICNVFRFAFRRRRAKLARIQDPRKRTEFAIGVARQALERSVRNVAIVDYYLKHVNDEGQLRLLDRWLAEEILSLAFKGGHRKSHFRMMPFRSLRAMGLPSLVHRRRQIQHGQIAAPFFVWKSYQTQKSSRETAARLRPQTAATAAFSPSPEAVAIESSQEELVGERSHLSRGLIEVGKSEDLPTFP